MRIGKKVGATSNRGTPLQIVTDGKREPECNGRREKVMQLLITLLPTCAASIDAPQ